jgi:hypothetical protein
MKRYESKKVVIIGGTSGMGLATAKISRQKISRQTGAVLFPKRATKYHFRLTTIFDDYFPRNQQAPGR